MQKLLVVALLSLSGCMMGSMYGITDESALISTASFDSGCPKDQLKIISSERVDMGSSLYQLEGCGKQLKYKRTGTVYHQADKSPIPGN